MQAHVLSLSPSRSSCKPIYLTTGTLTFASGGTISGGALMAGNGMSVTGGLTVYDIGVKVTGGLSVSAGTLTHTDKYTYFTDSYT